MVLAMLMAVTLAAATDATPRIPGTRLKLGMTEKQTQAAGTFAESPAAGAEGMTARKGELRFFGVLCQTTLHFRNGRLSRASFEAEGVSPQAASYVEGQLRRHRMWKECSRYDSEQHVCDWHGELKMHLETGSGRLAAQAEPSAPAPWENEPPPAAAAPVETPPVAAKPTEPPAATSAAPAPPPGPAKTEPAKETPPAASATTASAAAGGRPTPAPPAVQTNAAPSPTAVATLRDTLTISLVTKNSPAGWTSSVASPPLEYPDAARRESVQGIVWVRALVAADGSVETAVVDRGIRELNNAAVAWVQQSRFAPCMRENAPCRFWVRVAVRFTLY